MHRRSNSIAFIPAFLTFVALMARPAPLESQTIAASPGSRVRATPAFTQPRVIVGTLMSPITDSVVITVPARGASVRRHAIAVSSLDRLELSLGPSRSAGALRGVTYGLAASGAAAIACALSAGDEADLCAVFAVFAAVPFTAIGAIAGAVIRREAWRTVYRLPR